MASKAVVDAVKARLGTTWNGMPVFGPNERAGLPKDAAAFIDLEFPVATEEQITIGAPGANVYREAGVFRVIIAAARGSGADEGLIAADQIRALFRAHDFGNGLQTFAPNPPVIDDNNENGNYYMLGVAVPYQLDILG